MPEIIDQANELAERRLEMTIQNMRINYTAVSATHCRDCGKRYPSGAGNWWRAASAALTVRKKRNCAVNTGGDTSRCRTQTSLFSRPSLIVRRYRLCWEGFQGLLSGENADTGSKKAPLSFPCPGN